MPTESKSLVLKIQEESHISQFLMNQFLMNLWPDFESVQSALMNREVSLNLKTCVQEVLQEETRLLTQHVITDASKAFVVPTSEEAACLTPQGSQGPVF